jgi:hypothetical protein
MPQFTIDVPETLMPLLTRKAEGWRETPEEFIVNYLSVNLEHDDRDPTEGMRSEAQERVEDILEERDKGPFVPVPDDLVERVMEKAMARVQRQKTHV